MAPALTESTSLAVVTLVMPTRYRSLFGGLPGLLGYHIKPRPCEDGSVELNRTMLNPFAIGSLLSGASFVFIGVAAMLKAGTGGNLFFGPALLIAIPLVLFGLRRTVMIHRVIVHENGDAELARRYWPLGRPVLAGPTSSASLIVQPIGSARRSKPSCWIAVALITDHPFPLALMRSEDEAKAYVSGLPRSCRSLFRGVGPQATNRAPGWTVLLGCAPVVLESE